VLAARYGEEVGRLGVGVVLIGGRRWRRLGAVLVRMGRVGLQRG